MEKVQEIWQKNQDYAKQVRQRFMIMLKRDLTDQEQLLRSFGDGKEPEK